MQKNREVLLEKSVILSCTKENNYLSELISLEVLSRGDLDQSGLFSPILKRKWEGARRSRSQRASIPWGCAHCKLRLSGFRGSSFSPPGGVSPTAGRGGALRQPHFPSCPAVMPCSLWSRAPADPRRPARRAEPGKGTPAGVPATWRIGRGAKREDSGGRG